MVKLSNYKLSINRIWSHILLEIHSSFSFKDRYEYFKNTSSHYLHMRWRNFWIASTSGDIIHGTLITRPFALDIAIFAITKAYNIPYSDFLCWLENFSLFSRQKDTFVYTKEIKSGMCSLFSIVCCYTIFSLSISIG